LQQPGGAKSETKASREELKRQVDEAQTEFYAAMDDDFNTPRALAAYIRIVAIAEEHGKSLGRESSSMLLDIMSELASVLGLLDTESVAGGESQQLVNLLNSLRTELRAKKEYAMSDRIREQMQKAGVLVEDEAK
jgi:cysteinyl-tRNA synthetase